MHISRHFPILPTMMDQPVPLKEGIRAMALFAAIAVAALAATFWMAAEGLSPAAPCLNDPGAVCEPF